MPCSCSTIKCTSTSSSPSAITLVTDTSMHLRVFSDVNRLKNLNRLKMSLNRLIIAINRLIAIKNFNRLNS